MALIQEDFVEVSVASSWCEEGTNDPMVRSLLAFSRGLKEFSRTHDRRSRSHCGRRTDRDDVRDGYD